MITANFDFIGRNPATILIMAGVLFILTGQAGLAFSIDRLASLTNWGIGFLAIGILIHLAWLFFRRR